MIQDFFQLQKQPFTSVPSPEQYFPASSIESTRTSLVRLVERTEGPALVIGPVGTGKTLLCQVLADSFRHRCRVVTLPSGRLPTRRALLQVILFELGLPYRDSDEGELRLSLIDHVTNRDICPEGLLLLVDEGENLSLALLDELRSLTNLVCDGRSCIRLTLFGAPRLEEKFTHPRLESFNQRLAGRFYLEAFDSDETGQFVRQTFSDCGGNAEDTFTADALRTIHQACGGIPRLVNQLADHALVLTATGNHDIVDSACVEEAWADLQQLPMPGGVQPHDERPSAPENIVEFGQLDDNRDDHPVHREESLLDEIDQPLAAVPMHAMLADEDIPEFDTADQETSNEETLDEKILNDDDNDEPEVTLVFHSSSNPFGDDFEEEEVVVDDFISPDALAQRHRRQVEADASDRLARQMYQLRQHPVAARPAPVDAGLLENSTDELDVADPTDESPNQLLIEDKTEDIDGQTITLVADTDQTELMEEIADETATNDCEIIYLGNHADVIDAPDTQERSTPDDSSERCESTECETNHASHSYSTLFSRLRRRHG